MIYTDNIMTKYSESVSGFKMKGEWSDVVEHGERIAFALEELNCDEHLGYDTELDEYNYWRPKIDENVDSDINDKTSESVVSKQDLENKKPQKEIKKAGKKAIQSYEQKYNPDEFIDNWKESANHASNAILVSTKKSIHKVEEKIYKNVMTVISPYYFDNNLISANMNRISSEPYIYELEININDDEIKQTISEKLESYEKDYKRWHISANKNVEEHLVAEGTEDITDNKKEQNIEDKSKPTCT